jgi:hypothetical protein
MVRMSVKQLLRFANSLGLRVDLEGSGDATYAPSKRNWEGTITLTTSIRMLVSQPETSVRYLGSQLAHELGHYLVAPKSRRRKKDYGIPPASSAPIWTTEETKARIVEHYLRKRFGDPRAFKDPIKRFARNRRSMGDLKVIKAWWDETGLAMVNEELRLFRKGTRAFPKRVRRSIKKVQR